MPPTIFLEITNLVDQLREAYSARLQIQEERLQIQGLVTAAQEKLNAVLAKESEIEAKMDDIGGQIASIVTGL